MHHDLLSHSVPTKRVVGAVIGFVLCALIGPVSAQTSDIRNQLTTVATGLGPMDDIVMTGSGDIVIAKPSVQRLDLLSPAGVSSAMPIPPIISAGIELFGGGALIACDISNGVGQGEIKQIDLATFSVTSLASGFNIPIDVVRDSPTSGYVCDLVSTNFQSGPCYLWRVDWSQSVPGTKTLIAGPFNGPADICIGPQGLIFLTAFGETQLKVIDPATGSVFGITLSEPLLGATDIVPAGPAGFFISLLPNSRVVYVEPAAGVVVAVADHIGGTNIGAEDLGYDMNGNLLVSLTQGTIFKIDTTSALRQLGTAHIGDFCYLVLENVGPPGDIYAIGCAFGAQTGQYVGSQFVPIDPDPLFFATLAPRPSEFVGFDGVLDTTGSAIAQIVLPFEPSIAGFIVYFAVATFDPASFLPLTGVSNAVRLKIEP